MARSLLLVLASALSAAGGNEHPLCDTCDGGAGLSLLQRAGRSRDSPRADVVRFPGARIIYVEVPVSPSLALVAGPAGLLGDSTPALMGGPVLNIQETAKLWIADFPSAQMGWQGVPGASARLDLPHHHLSVKLPLVHHGERLCHSAYALVDDDEVMLLMRMGEGIPAKLAKFEVNTSRLRVQRRGVEVLAAELQVGPAVEAAELEHIFALTDLTRLGTQVQRPGALFLRHSTRAEITSARKLHLHDLRLSESAYEPVRMLLGDISKAEAWLLEANLEVSTVVAGSAGIFPNFMAAAATSFGAPVTRVQPFSSKANLNYQNGQVLWLRQQVNPAALAQLLPPGMEAEDDRALVFVVYWQPAAIYATQVDQSDMPFVYSEFWLVARVRYKGRSFNHPILMLLDDDVAMMTGHDFMGCPKKLGNFSMDIPATAEGKAPVSLNVNRRGRRVLDLRAEMGEPHPRLVTGLNDNANGDFVWIFSQEFAREGHTPVYQFVTSKVLTHEARELHAVHVEWGDSPQEPLHELFVEGPPEEAGYMVMDQSWGKLGPGESSSPINYWGESIESGPYKKWWKRNFQMIYG